MVGGRSSDCGANGWVASLQHQRQDTGSILGPTVLKDPLMLLLLQRRSELQLRSGAWPGNIHMPRGGQKEKKKKKKKKKGGKLLNYWACDTESERELALGPVRMLHTCVSPWVACVSSYWQTKFRNATCLYYLRK